MSSTGCQNKKKPWLLIVDNADDHLRSHAPQDFIPESESGVVLFTTRNHLLRVLGDLALKFEGLDEDLSTHLLLTSAQHPQPFAPRGIRMAKEICQKFGCLPLSILHAGRAILQGICTLENCLAFVERSLARVKRIMDGSQTTQITGSLDDQALSHLDEIFRPASETVYATFELVIPAASEEALQLLRLLSFVQSQRFHFQILLKAVVNPRRQASADKQHTKGVLTQSFWQRSWKRIYGDLRREMFGYLQQLGERPALPSILRTLLDADPIDAEFGLRKVLSELRALALLDHDEEDDTYCMHSSVHWWVRASMGDREKSVWCQAACNVLALPILLPPVGIEDGDAQLRRQTYPHVQYATKQQKLLTDELRREQRKHESWWRPTVGTTSSRTRMLQDAKFSMVYAECGMWQESQELMLGVDKYLAHTIGLDDPISIRVRGFLSDTYWWLDKADEAVRLQEELLAACRKSLGNEHVDTLGVKDRLGSSFWQQGRFHRARELAQQAVDGFREAYPSGHVDRSRALTNLGRCVGKTADFDQAVDLHLEALRGLESAQHEQEGQYGDQILDVMENLAMARHDRHRYGRAQPDDLQEAEQLQVTVLDKHSKMRGKEHPRASCNLARITASSGALEKAEDMMRQGLPIAERTVGPNHIGTLMGKAYLGQILTLADKLDEAETVLRAVVEAHRARDGQNMHPDHMVAAALLLDCCRRRQKHQIVDRLETEVLEGIRHLFGQGSPWEDYFIGRYTMSTEAGASRDE